MAGHRLGLRLDLGDGVGQMGLQFGVTLGDQGVGALLGVGGGAVEIIDVGADGDETEAARRLPVGAGEVRDRGGGGQLPQAGPIDRKGPRSAVPGQIHPAGALRRVVQITAIQPDGAGLHQFGGPLLLQALVLEGRGLVEKGADRQAAGLPVAVQPGLQPGNRRFAGFGIVADDGVMAGMDDRAALVVPDEGVVARRRLGNRRIAVAGRQDVVGEFHDVGVVERQGDPADHRPVAGHRRRPADQTLETAADRVFRSGEGRLFGGEGNPPRRRRLGRVRADHRRRDIGADDVRHVDLTGLQRLQRLEIAFRLDEGVAPLGDVAQLGCQQRGGRDLRPLHPSSPTKVISRNSGSGVITPLTSGGR